MNKKVIIFDICGTLYHSNTTCDFCEWVENRFFYKNLLKFSKSIVGKIINKIFELFFNYDLIRNLHVWSLKGKSMDDIVNEADAFVESFLKDKKIMEVHEILSSKNKNNVVLISATLYPVAKAIAKNLRIALFYSTSLSFDKNNILSGKIDEDLSGNKHKLFKNKKVDFIATDNLNDYKLCLMSEEVVIISKQKHLKLWDKKKLKIDKLIKL